MPEFTCKEKISMWWIFVCGICMGTADLVPGISGGTIAFIMGFYNQLLDSIKTLNASSVKLLLQGKFRSFFQAVAWRFLLPLLSGISVSFIAFARLFHFILDNEIYRIYLYSIFLGLILASFWFCVRQLKEWKAYHMMGLVCGAAIAYILTGSFFIAESQGPFAIKIDFNEHIPFPSLNNYDTSQKLLLGLSDTTLGAMVAKGIILSESEIYNSEGKFLGQAVDFIAPYHGYRIDIWLIFCGAVAICALLLPGISGSYLLALLGVYPLVIGALADFIIGLQNFSFDHESFYVLLSLLIGIGGGVVIFARFVSWLLKMYPNFSIAVLSGFMIGALRSVWPFWSYEYTLLPLKLQKGPQLLAMNPIWPSLTSPYFLYGVLFAVLGFGLVVLVEYVAKLKLNKILDVKTIHEQEL